jgi:hypothetical protein
MLSRPQGYSAAGRIRPIEKSDDFIGNRNRNLPAGSIVPQPTTQVVMTIRDNTKFAVTTSAFMFVARIVLEGRDRLVNYE